MGQAQLERPAPTRGGLAATHTDMCMAGPVWRTCRVLCADSSTHSGQGQWATQVKVLATSVHVEVQAGVHMSNPGTYRWHSYVSDSALCYHRASVFKTVHRCHGRHDVHHMVVVLTEEVTAQTSCLILQRP